MLRCSLPGRVGYSPAGFVIVSTRGVRPAAGSVGEPAGRTPLAGTKNRNYARGADFERRTMTDLVENGYRVIRAAGSHGKADIVALKPGQVILVQCKLTGPGGVGPAEWNELFDLAQYAGAVALVAHRPRRGHIEYLRIFGRKLPGVRLPPVALWVPDLLIAGTAGQT
jgi:Holliday junction resolvase